MPKNVNMPPEENMSDQEWANFVVDTDKWRENFLRSTVYDSQKTLARLAGMLLASDGVIITTKKRSGHEPVVVAYQHPNAKRIP